MLKILIGLALTFALHTAGAANVLVFGDSLSAGYGISRDSAWPVLLAHKLKHERYPYQVVNASISGETTAGGRSRLPALLAEHKPKVVVLELGANDGLRGLPVDEMRKNLANMIEASQKSGAKVVLVGMRMPPNYGPLYTRQFEAAFKQLARVHKLPLVPFLFEGIADKRELFQADGLHPTAQAQPMMLANVWPALTSVLKR